MSIRIEVLSQPVKFCVGKMNIGHINANILSIWFVLARYMGLVFVRFKRSKDNNIAFEDSSSNRQCWKWFAVILRLAPPCFFVYRFNQCIRNEVMLLQVVHYLQVFVLITTCLSMSHLHIYHGHELIKLVNRYLYLYRQVRSTGFRSDSLGFGSGRELLMIVIFFSCQCDEIIIFSLIYPYALSASDIAFWGSHCYIAIASNMIIYVNFIWYLSLGVLFNEVQKCLCLEFQLESETLKLRYRSRKRLKRTMAIFSEICEIVTSLQRIINGYLLYNQFQKCFSIVFIAHEMLFNLQFLKFWQWASVINVMFRLLILILAIQTALNKFRCIQEFTLGLFFASKLTDWNKTVGEYIYYCIVC